MKEADKPAAPPAGGSPPNVDLWSREGFVGTNAIGLRADYTPNYLSVSGPHAPKRIYLYDLQTADRTDAQALPTPILLSRVGVKLSVSRRTSAMPYTVRNTEADELHFVQSGKVRYDTEFGSMEAGACDLVCIPRAVSYRMAPGTEDLLVLIIESPAPLRFDTPSPFGMINFGVSVRHPKMGPTEAPGSGPYTLLLKTEDGVTRFQKPHDPVAGIAHIGGTAPVWALNLSEINPVTFGGLGGAPAQFLVSGDGTCMFFPLSSRAASMRAPIHHNADYDELILFARGPGAWGAVSEPGTLCHTPKGVTHQGPTENVAEGYLALLLETRATMRFTPEASSAAHLAETDQYAIHASDGTYDKSASINHNGSKK